MVTRDGAASLRLRAASEEDSDILLEWRNDPVTRRMSRNTGIVGRDVHRAWFASALRDPARLLLIGCLDSDRIGMARFDLLAPGVWEVSINLDPHRRGTGLSRPLLSAALKEISHRAPRTIVAEIKPENAVSRHLFEGAGFRLVRRDETMDRYELVPSRSG